MGRADYAWLLVKAAGLWLLVRGVDYVAPAVMTLHRWSEKPTEDSLTAFLDAAVPIAVGLFLLFGSPAPLLRGMGVRDEDPQAGEPDPAAPATRPGLGRFDWLWLACKVLGVWFVA